MTQPIIVDLEKVFQVRASQRYGPKIARDFANRNQALTYQTELQADQRWESVEVIELPRQLIAAELQALQTKVFRLQQHYANFQAEYHALGLLYEMVHLVWYVIHHGGWSGAGERLHTAQSEWTDFIEAYHAATSPQA